MPAPQNFGHGTKRCPRCGETKPRTAEHWNTNPRPMGGVRARAYCRPCEAAGVSKWRDENRARSRAYHREYSARHLERKRLWRLRDRQANPEKYRERKRRYYAANRERCLAQAAQNRSRNAKTGFGWRERNREHLRLSTKRWRESNPEKAKIGRVNQWAKRNMAPGKITVEEIRAIYRSQHGRCFYCATALRGKFQVDHKVPLTRGGTNWASNVCCACGPCNRRKYTRTAEEFIEARRRGVA